MKEIYKNYSHLFKEFLQHRNFLESDAGGEVLEGSHFVRAGSQILDLGQVLQRERRHVAPGLRASAPPACNAPQVCTNTTPTALSHHKNGKRRQTNQSKRKIKIHAQEFFKACKKYMCKSQSFPNIFRSHLAIVSISTSKTACKEMKKNIMKKLGDKR